MIRYISKVKEGWNVDSAVTPMQYPGGEWSLNVEKAENEEPIYAVVTFEPTKRNISEELTQLGMWVDWCHAKGTKSQIIMPYLPAARADKGTPLGGKVYANLINALGADEVVIFDPHSPTIPSLIQNAVTITPARLIKNTLMGRAAMNTEYTAVIAPDKGATERAGEAAKLLHLPLIQAEKTRDFKTGELTGYHIDVTDAPDKGAYLVVDDICDGGGTFKLLAKNSGLSRERLSLWVSHGIFSGNAAELSQFYSKIYTTDSVVPYPGLTPHTVRVLPHLLHEARLAQYAQTH